jgi:hypothetical protein
LIRAVQGTAPPERLEAAVRDAIDEWSLEAGKRADLVLLSGDVFACREDDIKDVAPVLTMVGGEVVFQRAGLREETERS